MTTMIRVQSAEGIFNFRAAGIILTEDHKRVLLHRAVTEDFWSMPGGRVEVGETAADTIKREMLEESGLDVEVERLLWIVETFFEREHKSHHELGLYFLLSITPNSDLYQRGKTFSGIEANNVELIYQWFDTDKLNEVQLFPSFLRQGLANVPSQLQHLVHFDED